MVHIPIDVDTCILKSCNQEGKITDYTVLINFSGLWNLPWIISQYIKSKESITFHRSLISQISKSFSQNYIHNGSLSSAIDVFKRLPLSNCPKHARSVKDKSRASIVPATGSFPYQGFFYAVCVLLLFL